MRKDLTRQQYKAMAKFIRRNGFTPEYEDYFDRSCGCFIHAADYVTYFGTSSFAALRQVVGYGLEEGTLRRRGWDEFATKDAAAACEIAADLVAP